MKSISKLSAVLVFIILLPISAKANMASPQFELLSGVSTISSSQIDILHEDLKITLDSFFNNVFFNVHYRIKASKTGKQIPLLFIAESYKSNFTVEVDGKPVEVLRIPETFYESERWMDYNLPKIEVKPDEIYVDWPEFQKVYEKKDVQYFEVDLTQGEHSIVIRYEASAISEEFYGEYDIVTTETSIKYLLSPAKLWKSFGGLNLTIDGTDFFKENTAASIYSDFGILSAKEPVKHWKFDSIPQEYFYISYQPKSRSYNFKYFMAYYKPAIIIYGTGFILLLIIAYVIYRYKRNKNLNDKKP
ncbi:MAG: hypothetical protein LC105_06980 [Chitinophagales bacterium]|nr:hypothetical protein [Chitinophagales bacterium]MCZ2393579.1 hypothetical protein [Chitinophagales bacterium]